jgi:hypothetical protein
MLGDPNLCPPYIREALDDYASTITRKAVSSLPCSRTTYSKRWGVRTLSTPTLCPTSWRTSRTPLPADSWGSPAAVTKWLAMTPEKGESCR